MRGGKECPFIYFKKMAFVRSCLEGRRWFICMTLVWLIIRILPFHVSPKSDVNKPVRILCWITTSPKTKSRAELVKKTWANKCDHWLFMSSERDEALPAVALPVNDSYVTLWGKTQEALGYIYLHHLDDAEWFFKADDDTFTVVENLRYFVSSLDHSMPLFLGSRRRMDGLLYGYFDGGAGYLLTKESIRLFVEYAKASGYVMCDPGPEGLEDVNLGECLEKLGVVFGDSRDGQGHHRFLQFPLTDHFRGNFWLNNTNFYPSKKGFNCCSNTTISFHKTKDNQLVEYDYLINHLVKPTSQEPMLHSNLDDDL